MSINANIRNEGYLKISDIKIQVKKLQKKQNRPEMVEKNNNNK